MILDSIAHAAQYRGLLPAVDRALAEAQAYTPENFPAARVDLDGDALYLLPAHYETHPFEEAMFEAHRRYIDVMYMVEGRETVYVKPLEHIRRVAKPYDRDADALLAEPEPDASAVRLDAGSFLVLFPQDAHAPACHADGAAGKVKKIIVKVAIR